MQSILQQTERAQQVDPEHARQIEDKFTQVFGNRFRGHGDHLQKKMNALRTKFMEAHRKGKKHFAQDFMDIHKYRHAVNQNVYKAIVNGTFAMAKTLNEVGNLMEFEDKHVFMIEPTQVPGEPHESKYQPQK